MRNERESGVARVWEGGKGIEVLTKSGEWKIEIGGIKTYKVGKRNDQKDPTIEQQREL